MRFSVLLAAVAATLPVFAQEPLNETEYSVTDQSANFNMVVISPNATLNGSLLGACHDGAAFEGVCIIEGGGVANTENYVEWQFNTTRYICTNTNSSGTFPIDCNPGSPPVDPLLEQGYITWWLQFTGTDGPSQVSQGVFLQYFPWTNVAMLQVEFGPSPYTGGTYVAFDANECLYIQQYQDDTLEPGYEYLSTPIALYRWYICDTYWSGYTYTTLTWVLGKEEPQNPTCQKVDVKRVFV